jgi:hypothetical protein
MKYVIYAVSVNGSKTTNFEFEYESDEELTLNNLITNRGVVDAALQKCPVTPTTPDEVQGLRFERLRHLLVEM